MPVSLLATLAALALGAGGAPQQAVRDTALSASTSVPDRAVLGEALSASGGAEALRDAALAALAPPPEKVVRTTRSFGTVTIDHRAHLARKAHCADCHGKGPVTKIEFTPRVAHDRCIGCHREQQRGPMACRQCHEVKPPPAPAMMQAKAEPPPQAAAPTAGAPASPAAAAPALAAAAPATSGVAAPAASGVAAPAASGAAPPAAAGALIARSTPADLDSPVDRDRRFTRILSAGFAGSSGAGQGASGGPAFYFTARQDGYLLSVSVETPGRTLGLLGGGTVIPLRPRFNAIVLGVGGFDAAQRPSLNMMPALGGRVGVEWLGNRSTVGLTLTGLSDLTRPSDGAGGSVGGFTLSVAASVGWVVAD
ncbi:cytochrome c3 family protein [Anaeromyxobacter diazotrophicus]|uniref:Cytochrome c7-like domain-containing protein n=1 Tax=Anaeromyxobacter diazotrophicus TaxID=2590199 RepID=A0A7I9VLT5_9BACT|nr:cytochrome c3 family protein [Anaeromyxobacter diazotrophicus]GEJ57090.1 hypothetical protein AMYX_18310 [Anaeromyxobacter diazotrophicus]